MSQNQSDIYEWKQIIIYTSWQNLPKIMTTKNLFFVIGWMHLCFCWFLNACMKWGKKAFWKTVLFEKRYCLLGGDMFKLRNIHFLKNTDHLSGKGCHHQKKRREWFSLFQLSQLKTKILCISHIIILSCNER